jgi:hypothetical protein
MLSLASSDRVTDESTRNKLVRWSESEDRYIFQLIATVRSADVTLLITLTIADCKGIEAYSQDCPKCAQEYEKAGLVMNLVREYWSGRTENQLIIKRTEQPRTNAAKEN